MSSKRNETLVTALAAVARPVVAGETGIDDIFNDHLPEGVTPEHVEKIATYTGEYIAAGAEVLGDVTIKAMVEDTELQSVHGHFGIGALGEVDIHVNRSKEERIPKTNEKVLVYGGNRVVTSFRPGDKLGALAAAQKGIKEAAKEALSK